MLIKKIKDLNNNKCSILFVAVLLLVNLTLQAQKMNAAETLKKVEAYYKKVNAFDIQIEYKMFRGLTGNNMTESYKGTMYKNGSISKVNILGSEIIQLPEAKIVVNKANKTLMYNKATKDGIQGSPVDMSAFLKFYQEKSSRTQGNTIELEMVLKNAQIPAPYNKIVLYIDKTTYQINKQELYLSTKVPFVDENGKGVPDLARMEISFKPNPNPLNKVPQLKDYVSVSASNNVTLSSNYINYTIIDQANP